METKSVVAIERTAFLDDMVAEMYHISCTIPRASYRTDNSRERGGGGA